MRAYLHFVMLVLIVTVLGWPLAVGQAGKGTIIGKVTDNSQAILPGATVKLDQSAISVISDSQGQFTIPNVDAGAHTLTVDYVGFSPSTASVTVAAGQTAHVDVVMNVATETEQILVTAERAHGEAESINEEKVADNILNVLPSEIITSLPNANIADAVGRLPGVTLERDEGEGKYVQIRGTEPRLANLTIDGVEVPSPEGGVRQVKLDVIPADLIESVQINKTLQANMNGDAIGGSVNMVTKKAGSRPELSLYGNGGFTPIIDTRKVYEFGGTAGKRFGVNQRLGLMVSGSYDYNGRGIDDVEPAPWETLQTGPTTFIPNLTSVAFREYLYDRKRYGFGASADYKLSENSNLYVHSLYSDFKDYGHRFEYILNPTNDASFCSNPANPPCVPGFTTEIRNPDFLVASLSVGGNHVFGTSLLNWQAAVGRARMINPIGGGESHNNFSASPTFSSTCMYQPQTTTNPYYPQFSPSCFSEAYNPANQQLSQIQFSDHGLTAQLNLEGTVSYAKNYHLAGHTSTFETGFYIRNAHKFDNSFEVDWTPNNTITADQIPGAVTNFHNSDYYGKHYQFGPGISYEAINRYLAANQSQFTASTGNYPNSNNFDLVERVTAGYIMDSINFSRFRVVAGVRFEGTQDNSISFDNTTGTLTYPGHGSYISVLPSASLRLRLDSHDNSALRFVYARGLSRPDPAFLTAATSLDNSTHPYTLTVGNPALKPEHGNNFDILYERYLTPLGSLQAGVFYKELSDPIVSVLSGPKPILGCQDPSGTCFVNTAGNGGSAHITGLEIGFQQHLSYLPGALSGLGIQANYAYATSRAHDVNPGNRTDSPALLRQAPNTWNISPTYDRGRVSTRLGLAYNGANIFSYSFTQPPGTVTPLGIKGPLGDQYLYSHFQVDAQGSVRLAKGFTATVSGLNLNNEVFGFYQGSTQYPIQREFYKPTFTFGLRWDLQHEK